MIITSTEIHSLARVCVFSTDTVKYNMYMRIIKSAAWTPGIQQQNKTSWQNNVFLRIMHSNFNGVLHTDIT